MAALSEDPVVAERFKLWRSTLTSLCKEARTIDVVVTCTDEQAVGKLDREQERVTKAEDSTGSRRIASADPFAHSPWPEDGL